MKQDSKKAKKPERIRVRRYGSSEPTVVVLHGGPGAQGSAAGLAQSLAKDFIVLEPLQRRSGSVPLTVGQHIDDLAAIAPRPAILVGCSWGAMLGLSYAARFPERVSDLVLVGCGTYEESSRRILRESIQNRLSETEFRHLTDLQERCALEQDPTMRDELFKEIGDAFMRAESYELIHESEPPVEIIPADANGNVETWTDVLRLQHEEIEPGIFSAITAPVLMIHGDTDPHPGGQTHDLLLRYIPQIEYVEMERCGHEPWRERYARDHFLDILRKWILKNYKPPSGTTIAF